MARRQAVTSPSVTSFGLRDRSRWLIQCRRRDSGHGAFGVSTDDQVIEVLEDEPVEGR
jgi:hypothetical protein